MFYDWGVGSDRLKLTGGMFGKGLDKNIRDAYRFIVHNYDLGDELFLFGFSRGAFTVCSLAGLINNVGILKREYAKKINEAFKSYRNEHKPDAWESVLYRNKFACQDKTDINFIGGWDTVGSNGIPDVLFGWKDKKYRFHDTKLSKSILCAWQAVSINERRRIFRPGIVGGQRF